MKTILAIIGGFVVVLVLLLFAVCNDDDDNSLGRTFNEQAISFTVPVAPARFVASHDDGGECWDEYDCRGREYGDGDGYSQRYDQNYGSRDDRNRNRNRDRGAFSPGPFRDSPVTICLPYSCNSGGEQSGGNRENPPPRDEEPQR